MISYARRIFFAYRDVFIGTWNCLRDIIQTIVEVYGWLWIVCAVALSIFSGMSFVIDYAMSVVLVWTAFFIITAYIAMSNGE